MVDVKMPLTAHLEELRSRLIRSLLAITGGFSLCYAFADPLFRFLARPLIELTESPDPETAVHLIGTGIAEAFFTKLWVAVIGGIFIASPVVLYQIWKFIVPGLLDSERRYARPFVIFGTLFFVAEYATIGVSPEIRISEYLTFTSRMLLAFGVTFEMPVVTFFLARIGLVTHQLMIRQLRYAIVGIFIVAAIMTPADVASQLLMAGPLLVLYARSIGVAYVFGTRVDKTEVNAEAGEP